MSKHAYTKDRTILWWNHLTELQKERVEDWIASNPPPDGWKYSLREWAYLECPLIMLELFGGGIG